MMYSVLGTVALEFSFVFAAVIGLNGLDNVSSMFLAACMVILERIGGPGLLLQSIDNSVLRVII